MMFFVIAVQVVVKSVIPILAREFGYANGQARKLLGDHI
jgi:cobalamin biosynthesis protein CbiG